MHGLGKSGSNVDIFSCSACFKRIIYSNPMPSYHIVHAQDPQDVVEQLQAISPLIMRPVSHTDQRSAQLPQHHG